MSNIFNTLLFNSIVGTIVLIFVYFILQRFPAILRKRYYFLLISLLITASHLILPFDYPFVFNIKVTNVLPEIYLFLYNPIITINNFTFSIFQVFTVIWIIGSIYCLGKLIWNYSSFTIVTHHLRSSTDKHLYQILENVLSNYKHPVCFRLVTSEHESTPFIFGIKNPCIVIPNIQLSDDEWYYVLSHEIAHYYQRDLIIKFLFELFHAIYWWNPLFYMIKLLISNLLEVKVDIIVTNHLEIEQKYSYLQCLLKIARLKESQKNFKFAATFQANSSYSISRRIKAILVDEDRTFNFHLHNFLTFTLVFCVLILPIFITFSPYSVPQEIEKQYFSNGNSFFIALPNGTFDLYVDNVFIKNLDSVGSFEDDIIIYTQPKEAKND
ncbi:beta-lactamase regulating signal transducer with metallopeptidase domain [Kineothrix alysoides]|uniref:Beta-lactamase regulating signal transducer with metallopeptidase domain n=1 Tax=Kineothrix alysoides TaxID=1469948 RepID=A0A4R1QY47_9FIRM|nr:M56 family metallopeptidase [Kineothrix alysoides]TCL57614.1 beta-lactamase regulating signal transducer with metallopeptidase domain [Kineothrix alysoides]